jgi:small subunit ribosomal protein S12
MSTINQLSKKTKRLKKKRNVKTPILGNKNPQRKIVCTKVYTMTPRKPNSAKRKVANVKVREDKRAIAYIPGIGHNLKEYSVALLRGGRVKDLPGIKYKLVRGIFDFKGVAGRKRARSKYGVRRSDVRDTD